jgi:hypothetical protein
MAHLPHFLLLGLLASAQPGPETYRRLASHMSVLGIHLQKNTIADAQKRLGKAEVRHNGGDAGASASAACYVGPDGTVLAFISVSEAGEGRQLITDFHLAAKESLVIFSPIVLEYAPRASRPVCSRLGGLSKSTGTPGGLRLGMPVAEVTSLLGKPTTSSADELAYHGENDNSSGVRRVRLQLANGVVTGILAEVDAL